MVPHSYFDHFGPLQPLSLQNLPHLPVQSLKEQLYKCKSSHYLLPPIRWKVGGKFCSPQNHFSWCCMLKLLAWKLQCRFQLVKGGVNKIFSNQFVISGFTLYELRGAILCLFFSSFSGFGYLGECGDAVLM